MKVSVAQPQELGVDQVAQAVDHQQVDLLDSRGRIGRHADLHVALAQQAGEPAALAARQRHDGEILLVRRLDRCGDAGRVAARGDRDQHVGRLAEGANLLGSILSILLFPIIPFSAYFAFGATVSALLSLFYAGLAVVMTWRHNPDWYLNPMTTYVLIAFVLLLFFMQMLARAIQRDEANRRELEKLLFDLEVSHRTLQAYAEQVGELVATEERNRLARDIHDSLGHSLTAVNIQLEKGSALSAAQP